MEECVVWVGGCSRGEEVSVDNWVTATCERNHYPKRLRRVRCLQELEEWEDMAASVVLLGALWVRWEELWVLVAMVVGATVVVHVVHPCSKQRDQVSLALDVDGILQWLSITMVP